jgi:hypothetical protein
MSPSLPQADLDTTWRKREASACPFTGKKYALWLNGQLEANGLGILWQENCKVDRVAAIACNRGAEGTGGFLKKYNSLEVSAFFKRPLAAAPP